MVSAPAYALSHYQIGYNDGCSGTVVPGHHTQEYRQGYAAGQANCGGGGSNGGLNGGGNIGQSHSSLVSKVCNFANTNPTLAAGAATLLGYPGLDVAVRTLCAMR